MVNTVDKEKKVGHVLSGIGATAYSMLQNLLLPTIPKGGDLATIKQKLAQHRKLKLPLIGKQFIFYQQTLKRGELINQF